MSPFARNTRLALCLLVALQTGFLQAETYDMGSMSPGETLAIHHFPASGDVSSGIFAHHAQGGVVTVAADWVNTPGAGMYFGSEASWTPPGSCLLYVRDRENTSSTPAYLELPVTVENDGSWHRSEVLEDVGMQPAGEAGRTLGLARPLQGAIRGLRFRSGSLPEFVPLTLTDEGRLSGGSIDTLELGRLPVRFIANLQSNRCYIELGRQSFDALLRYVPLEDHDAILAAAKRKE